MEVLRDTRAGWRVCFPLISTPNRPATSSSMGSTNVVVELHYVDDSTKAIESEVLTNGTHYSWSYNNDAEGYHAIQITWNDLPTVIKTNCTSLANPLTLTVRNVTANTFDTQRIVVTDINILTGGIQSHLTAQDGQMTSQFNTLDSHLDSQDGSGFSSSTDSLKALSDSDESMHLKIGTPDNFGGGASLSRNTADMAGATFDGSTDSLEAISNSVGGISGGATSSNDSPDSYDTGTLVGTVVGTIENAKYIDNLTMDISDDTGNLTADILFNIGSDGVPVSASFIGRGYGSGDDLIVQAWDYDANSWVGIGILNGDNGTIFNSHTYTLFSQMVGSGANLGEVKIRFTGTGLNNATLYIEQIFVTFVQINRSVGYANGAVWLDTSLSNTNAVPFVDGVADNPVSTLAAALTLLSSTGLKTLHIAQGSTVPLNVDIADLEITGIYYVLMALGNKINNCSITGAVIPTGVINSDTGSLLFRQCTFGNITIPDSSVIQCVLGGTLTFNSDELYLLDHCTSAVAGQGSPILDISNVTDININMRHYSGGIEIKGMEAGDTASIEGNGQIVIDQATCTGGNISTRGNFDKSDPGEIVTFSDNARFGMDQFDSGINANLVAIDGETTDGNNATLKLKRLDLQNADSEALYIKTTGNTAAARIEGSDALRLHSSHFSSLAGNGDGLLVTSEYGNGIKATSIDSSSAALKLSGLGGAKDISAKEIDEIKAVTANNFLYNESTGIFTFYKEDGTTPVLSVKVDKTNPNAQTKVRQ